VCLWHLSAPTCYAQHPHSQAWTKNAKLKQVRIHQHETMSYELC
jgi:hypothetical protein